MNNIHGLGGGPSSRPSGGGGGGGDGSPDCKTQMKQYWG